MSQTTLINSHAYEYNEEFQYYRLAVELDRLNDVSNAVFVLIK